MATNHEEVKIKLGVDQSSITGGLAAAEGKFAAFGKKITAGFKQVGLGLASALGLSSIRGAINDVAADIDEMFDDIDVKAMKLERKLERLKQLSPQERSDIVAGDVALDEGMAGVKMFVAKQAAKAAALAREIGASGFNPFSIAHGKGMIQAHDEEIKRDTARLKAERAANEAKANAEKMVELKKREAAVHEHILKVTAAAFKLAEAERLARANAMSEAQGGVANARGSLFSAFRGLSDVSLGEAQSLVGLQELPGLNFSKKQVADIQRSQLLQRQAQQARIDGNFSRADSLTSERLDILKRNSFLAEADRNPLKVLEDHLTTAQETLKELRAGIPIKAVKK